MPIHPPALDDRTFDDLVDESLRRIPAHTPEWTNPRLGDPGRTLVELFAWLTETLLYRANLIPERQRLVFLRLLGLQMQPATAARGVVSVSYDDPDATAATTIAALATLKAPVPFETRHELTVLPVAAEAYSKRPLSAREEGEKRDLLRGLSAIYKLTGRAIAYATTPVFAGGAAEPDGFDVIGRTVDRCLWLALLAPKPQYVAAARAALGSRPEGGQQMISIGVVPAIEVAALLTEIGPRPRVPHVWEISSVNSRGIVEYHALDQIDDTSEGLTQRGVLRLALPEERFIGAPPNDVRVLLDAGVGERPPRLDVPEKAARLVAWIRLRPTVPLTTLSLSWVGINAADVDQRQTVRGRVIGQSTGAADQEFSLPGTSVEAETLEIQVDETGYGYVTWAQVDDLAIAGRDDAVYALDAEAGTIRFGDGVRGRIPDAGRRIRVARMRSGGGAAGNLPAGSLTGITAYDLAGDVVPRRLAVQQGVPTVGGDDAETPAEAEQRIPKLFRNRDRAVTGDDYRHVSAATPGVRLGRVEVLPRFKPQQRRPDVPGVVTVMVLPQKDGTSAPAPRPDRPTLEAVHRHLDARRALGTELYVIGCEYVPVGVSVSITVRNGFGHDAVAHAVRQSLRDFLWPLVPGGNDAQGWQLGRAVTDRELVVAVARVTGVNAVNDLNLFKQQSDRWQQVPVTSSTAVAQLQLRQWQLPELLAVVVVTDGTAPTDLQALVTTGASGAGSSGAGSNGAGRIAEIAVPVVPEVC